MTIYLYDGSIVTCEKLEVGRDGLILDEYRIIPIEDVVEIRD